MKRCAIYAQFSTDMQRATLPVPSVGTVDVPRPEFRSKAVAVLVEDEERMVADRLEVAVVGRLLLRAVDWALGAVDIQDQPPRERVGRLMLHQAVLRRASPW
jgi:hypothetical protein